MAVDAGRASLPARTSPGPDRDTLRSAAEQYGTPVYVFDEGLLAEAASSVETAFPDPWLRHYSFKANDLPAVGAVFLARGWSANVVSTGEWAQASAAGFPESSISFEGIGKGDDQLADVVRAASEGRNLRWLVVESADEVRVLARLAAGAELGYGARPPLDVLVRLNPQVEPETSPDFAVGARTSKFGLTETEILSLADGGLPGGPTLRWRGVHVHTGSLLGSVEAWSLAGRRAAALCARLAEDSPTCDTVDFGGGFPAVAPGLPTPEDFRHGLEQALHTAGVSGPARRAIEPGRCLVASAGRLVTRVLHVRGDRGGRPQVVIDAGMTELIRPALYGAHHPIEPLERGDADAAVPTAVEGSVCESTDTFGVHSLPPLRRGDLLVIGEAGAYSSSFTSRFNGRPPPVEVLRRADGSLEVGRRAPLPPWRRHE